ncbi:MAG: rhodanese-like domain-containing protein [Acidobacteriota bacterium]|nr:rhodanese-like domain-containing protein [Acidobacteriota bacterium]
MTKQIEADTLRAWLDEHRPVTVLDIRADQDRAQWAIPGSMHLDAYDALRSGQPGQLADATFPLDRPIVTVCNAGRVSQAAAEFLAERGFDVRSLSGGMKAWSLAWNTARVPTEDDGMTLIQVRRTGKGCLSYVLMCDGDAAVIDASLPLEVYEDIARSYAARIRRVIETHIHADHLSRARQLADRVGAQLLLPQQERVAFPFTAVQDGDAIAVGSAKLIARHTPGHTLESMSYVLTDSAVFTGDTLFTKGVGRPDLHADAAGARDRARALFQSLRAIRTLGSEVIVLPAHTSEPIAFDGRPVMSRMSSIDKWLGDWMGSEASFIARVVSRLPETPPNFGRIVELNERGEMPDVDATELEAGANRCAVS